MNFTPKQVITDAKNKKPRRIWKFLLLSLVGLLLFVLLFVITAGRDHGSIDDSDMLIQPASVLAEVDNAHYSLPVFDDFTNEQQVVIEAALDIARDYDVADRESIQQAVTTTKPLTDAFIAASNRAGYQCPDALNNYSYGVEYCALSDIRDLAQLTMLRAYESMLSGEVDAAIEESLAVVSMASILTESQHHKITHLVSMALYNMTHDQLVVILQDANDEQKVIIQQTIQEYSPEPTKFANAMKAEYMSYKSMIRTMDTNTVSDQYGEFDKPGPYSLHPNRTTEKVYDFMKLRSEYYALPCIERSPVLEGLIQEEVIASTDLTLSRSLGMLILPNRIGERFYVRIIAAMAGDNYCDVESLYEELVTQ